MLDKPGLGKTLTIIRLAEELKRRNNITHCLVICGVNSLKLNWKKEIEKFSDLPCKIIGLRKNVKGKLVKMSIAECVEDLKNPIEEFFVITNIEKLRDKKLVKALKNGINTFEFIAFDEAHTAKSNNAQQTSGLMKLKSPNQVAMTGTIILNNPLDAFVPLHWIDADRSTLTNFKSYYCVYDGNEVVGYKNINYLKDQLESVSIRRTKDLLDLPPKTVIDEFVEMDDTQSKFYNNIRRGIKDEVDKVVLRTSNLLAMISRLRQATECPQVLTTESIESAKVNRCVDLVEQILSDSEEKVVIFSVFKEPLYKLNSLLSKYNPLLCTGDQLDSLVGENITNFQTLNNSRVLLGTVGKVGTGVTLNRARYAIFLSTPWTAGVQEQAEDRIHRVDNKYPVFIYRLWTSGTIDERVLELITVKSALSDYIVDNKINDENALNSLRKYILEDI